MQKSADEDQAREEAESNVVELLTLLRIASSRERSSKNQKLDTKAARLHGMNYKLLEIQVFNLNITSLASKCHLDLLNRKRPWQDLKYLFIRCTRYDFSN